MNQLMNFNSQPLSRAMATQPDQPQPDQPRPVVIKVLLQDELRRVSFASPTGQGAFAKLHRAITSAFPRLLAQSAADFHLDFVDDEGDVCRMSSDEELAEAIAISAQSGHSLRLTAHLVNNASSLSESPSSSSSSSSDSSSSESSSSESSEPEEDKHSAPPTTTDVHRNIQCDDCGMAPIRGPRFKCRQCPNFDLCSTCEAKDEHPAEHVLIKLRVAVAKQLRGCGHGRSAKSQGFGPHGRRRHGSALWHILGAMRQGERGAEDGSLGKRHGKHYGKLHGKRHPGKHHGKHLPGKHHGHGHGRCGMQQGYHPASKGHGPGHGHGHPKHQSWRGHWLRQRKQGACTDGKAPFPFVKHKMARMQAKVHGLEAKLRELPSGAKPKHTARLQAKLAHRQAKLQRVQQRVQARLAVQAAKQQGAVVLANPFSEAVLQEQEARPVLAVAVEPAPAPVSAPTLTPTPILAPAPAPTQAQAADDISPQTAEPQLADQAHLEVKADQEPEDPDARRFSEQLQALHGMGFEEASLNLYLLKQHKGKVAPVLHWYMDNAQ